MQARIKKVYTQIELQIVKVKLFGKCPKYTMYTYTCM